MEDGKDKCTQYWPDGNKQTFKFNERSVEVEKIDENRVDDNIVICTLNIRPYGQIEVF